MLFKEGRAVFTKRRKAMEELKEKIKEIINGISNMFILEQIKLMIENLKDE